MKDLHTITPHSHGSRSREGPGRHCLVQMPHRSEMLRFKPPGAVCFQQLSSLALVLHANLDFMPPESFVHSFPILHSLLSESENTEAG